MGIGAGIFLLALGAILAFAVNATLSGIDLVTVGWILMGVGVLGIVLDFVYFGPRRRTYVRQDYPAAVAERADYYPPAAPVAGEPAPTRRITRTTTDGY